MIKSNYHVHTKYCDGKNTIEENVNEAINLGFTSLGFSPHAHQGFEDDVSISISDVKKYKTEVEYFKNKYDGLIELYAGIEKDYFADDNFDYDYVIGSVHYLKAQRDFCIDNGKDKMINIVNNHYNGNFLSAVRDFYELTSNLPTKTNCDIIGHFDIITIYNDGNALFDADCKEYKNYALESIEHIIKKYGTIFEINSGAVYRGYKSSVYPAKFLLEAIKSFGGEIILTTDSHKIESLNFGLDTSAILAKECGFKYAKEIKNGKFVDTLL